MRSKVLSYPPIESIKLRDDQRIVDRCNLDEEVERELWDIKRKHSIVVSRKEDEPVMEDDSLVINAKCGAPGAPAKFNRQGIGLKLGRLYYDKNVENALLGCRVGDNVRVQAGKEEEWPVTIEIESARYTSFRPLTDEDFRAEGELEGVEVSNEEEFTDYLREAIKAEENLSHFYDVVLEDLSRELVSKSEFEIDELELEEDIRRWYVEVEDLPDYPESDEDDGFIPYVQEMTGSSSDTREELYADLMNYYENAFKYNLILIDLAKDEPEPDIESFNRMMDELRAAGVSEKDIEAYGGYERYLKDCKLEIGQATIMAIIEKQLLN